MSKLEIVVPNAMTITFNTVSSLLDLLTPEQQLEAVESLSCYDAVIKHVSDQILDLYGMTDNGYCGGMRCDYSTLKGEGSLLDRARYAVAMSAPRMACEMLIAQGEAIKRLEAKIEALEAANRPLDCYGRVK
jgi:hypothetical protein